jgi:cytochrome c peroxidase
VLRALEQYVQALISYRTKYDQACDTSAVFKDCAQGSRPGDARPADVHAARRRRDLLHHCHDLPSAANVWLANNGIDVQFTDAGSGMGVFRPATLRNIALTAPYMHDGRFATLREVIDHYDHGIQDSPIPRHAPAQTRRHREAHGPAEEDKAALEPSCTR